MLLEQLRKKQYPTEHHDPTIQDNKIGTAAMYMALQHMPIPKEWYHYPELKNIDGMTVAMLLALTGQDIPKEWEHHNTLRSNCKELEGWEYHIGCRRSYHGPSSERLAGNTVAMFYAYANVDIPEKWQHDPALTNNAGLTIEDIRDVDAKQERDDAIGEYFYIILDGYEPQGDYSGSSQRV